MNNYAFIDAQNLNLGVRGLGWEVDYKKLRLYLKNKYNVSCAFMFIGYVPTNQRLYTALQKAGFILIYKPVVDVTVNGKHILKGNVDAELVLHSAAIEYENYDKAVIITNDGDFYCLVEYLSHRKKLERLLAPSKMYSKLFKPYWKSISTIAELKDSLERKTGSSGRSKP
ncbi:MAG: NYN domain-containing protein [Coriobacteriia bacterium]|nr:NYN domain-containing protein [Coriobacteriia bacterium]